MELPTSFIHDTCALLGDEAFGQLMDALDGEQPVSVRLNGAKWHTSPLLPSTLCASPVPWAGEGYYLERRPAFTFDPLFHAGCYYVQEASSMFLEQALLQHLPQEVPVVMLDLCAAPGGKSTHARSLLPEGSLLVANEVVRARSQVLAENLTKWGHPAVVVTNNDPADFSPLEECFDVILTDVPCSGEGMFRKDPVAVSEWSPENVEICWQRQRRILMDIWPCLKPGGLLIYSTCTYNVKENEENVRWLRDTLGAEILPMEVPAEWNITGNLLPGEAFPIYRFLPHRTQGEGFFLALLRKPGTVGGEHRTAQTVLSANGVEFRGKKGEQERKKERRHREKGAKTGGLSKEQLTVLHGWLSADPESYEWLAEGNRVCAFPKEHLSILATLRDSLRVVQAGVEVAELKGRDWVPAHALALSMVRHPAVFACVELNYEQAIAYLRKEAVTLPQTAARGIVLLTYRQVPLGFAKNIGARANNLYPPEWRIRSGYVPEEVLLLADMSR